MSVYAGLSLREVYERRCLHYALSVNSAVAKMLPEAPDDFLTLKVIDLSSNFLGCKGFLALLEVIRCAKRLECIDARGQQLDQDALDMLCGVLRTHPTVRKVNLSDNPLTVMGGASLLRLVKDNPNIDTIMLDNTPVKKTVFDAVFTAADHNKEAKRAKTKRSAEGERESPEAATSQLPANSTHHRHAVATAPQGSALTAAPLSPQMELDRRPSMVDTLAALGTVPSTIHPTVFDKNPLPNIEAWLHTNRYRFFDPQFVADDTVRGITPSSHAASSDRNEWSGLVAVQRAATARYGISSWRRITELFPHAQLFSGVCLRIETAAHAGPRPGYVKETPEGFSPVPLPAKVMKGFSWIFTCVDAAVVKAADPMGEATLRRLILGPACSSIEGGGCSMEANTVSRASANDLGLYAVRLFIEGAWRYILVDDFLPVDRFGELVFTHPITTTGGPCGGSGVAVWPCVLEKALAKVYGGYERLDAAWGFGIAGPGTLATSDSLFTASPLACGVPPCARTLADLTGGVSLVRPLSAAADAANVTARDCEATNWDALVELLSPVARSARPANGSALAIAISKSEALMHGPGGVLNFNVRYSGIATNAIPYELLQVRQVEGIRLVQLRSRYAGVEWNGAWCDHSSLWGQHPQVDLELHGRLTAPVPSAHPATAAMAVAPGKLRNSTKCALAVAGTAATVAPANQRAFWMSYLDFLTYFSEVHLCRIFTPGTEADGSESGPLPTTPDGAREQPVMWREGLLCSEWPAGTAAGPLGSSLTWYRNPHFRLQPYRRGFFFVHVCARDPRFLNDSTSIAPALSASNTDGIAFHILQAARYPIRAEEHTVDPCTACTRPPEAQARSTLRCGTRYTRTDSLSVECVLDVCDDSYPYWIIPSRATCDNSARCSGNDSDRFPPLSTSGGEAFYLRVFSTVPFQLSQERVEDHWCERVVEANVEASGDLLVGEGNLQLVIAFAEQTAHVACRTACLSTPSNGRLSELGRPLESIDELRQRSGVGSGHMTARSGRRETLGGSLLVCAAVDPQESTDCVGGAIALYVTEAELNASGQFRRLTGCVESDELIAQSHYTLGNAVYLEHANAIAAGDALTLLCCLQPSGRRAKVRFTVWSTLAVRQAKLLPAWPWQEVFASWPVIGGSGAFYEAAGNPQVELYPVRPNDCFIVRMHMLPSENRLAAMEPTIMITIVANHTRCGEGLLGRVPSERILARSEYVRTDWVQCEFEIGEDGMDSLLIIPSLQPAGSHGSCMISVASESGLFSLRQVGADSM